MQPLSSVLTGVSSSSLADSGTEEGSNGGAAIPEAGDKTGDPVEAVMEANEKLRALAS